MPRKLKKGYYVKGEFVAEGSERDLQLKAELKGLRDADDSTRHDQKKESDALQALGKELLDLPLKTLTRLQLPEKLHDALLDYPHLPSFEAKRRQMQFIGKLMRKLEDHYVEAARGALHEMRTGTGAQQTQVLLAEQWRDRLIASDEALTTWLQHYPGTDVQPLRALIRQARKDLAASATSTPAADAPDAPDTPATEEASAPGKKSRSYRELFQLLRQSIQASEADPTTDNEHDDDAAD